MRNSIIFGNASYIKDGVVKAKRLKRGEGWKQSYLSFIIGLDDVHGLKRQFLKQTGAVTGSGAPLLTWSIPFDYKGIIELGWWSDEVAQSDPKTHYLFCLGDGYNYIEITESQCYREMVMRINLNKQTTETKQ